LLVALAFGPAYTNAVFGQVNTFVLLDCIAFRWLLERRKPGWAGAVLAVGTWLKIYPVVCLLFVLLWERRAFDVRRSLVGFCAAFAGVGIATLTFIPPSVYAIYENNTLPAIAGGTFQYALDQSLPAAVARTAGPAADFTDYYKCPLSVVPPLWGRVLNTMVVVGAGCVGLWGKTPVRRLAAFLCVLAAVPIVSPLGWAYVYVLALPLALLALQTSPPIGRFVLPVALAVFFLPATLPLGALLRLPQVFQHLLWYDRYLVLTVFFLVWVLVQPRRLDPEAQAA
jgi:hypothetical protein